MLYKHFINLSIRELLHGSSLIFLVRIFSIMGTYIFIFLINKYFGSETLGLFSLAQSLLYIVSIIVTLGLDVLSVRLISKYKSDDIQSYYPLYRRILFLVIFFGSIITIISYNSASFISSSIFNDPKSYLPIKYFSLCLIPLAITIINSENFRGIEKVLHYSFYSKTSFLLYTSIILSIFILFCDTTNSLLPYYAFIIVCVALMFISTINIFKLFNFKNYTKTKNKVYSSKDLLIQSNPMMITNIVLHTLQWSSIILLGIFNSSSDVGVFTLVMKIGSITSLVLTSINGIAAPKISELFNTNNNLKLNQLIKNITQLTFVTSFPIIILLIIFNTYILNFMGSEYLIGRYTLFILLIGQFFNISCGSVLITLNMTNKQKIVRNITLFSLFINILFNLIFIPQYGINGAAIGTTVSLVICNSLGLYYVYKELKIKSYIRI